MRSVLLEQLNKYDDKFMKFIETILSKLKLGKIPDRIKLTGKYEMICTDKDGNLKWRDVVENLVTNAGKAQLALLAGDATATPFTYIAVGTSTTAVAVTDTTLTAEIVDTGLQRVAGTVTRITTSVTNDTYKVSTTFTATGTKTVEEVGVFNASSAGTMLSHALTGSKALASTDNLAVNYTLQFS